MESLMRCGWRGVVLSGGVRWWSGGGVVVVQNNKRVKKNGYLKITSPMNHMKPSIQ